MSDYLKRVNRLFLNLLFLLLGLVSSVSVYGSLVEAEKYGLAAEKASANRQYDDAVEYIGRALRLLGSLEDGDNHMLRASLLCQLGVVHIELGKWLMAQDDLLLCLKGARELNDNELVSEALVRLGQNGFKQGRFEEADLYLREAVSLTAETRDFSRQAFAYLWLGATAALHGKAKDAETLLMKAVDAASRAGDQATEGRARNILGENARLNGQYDVAIKHYHEALTIYESINNRFGMTMVIHNLGHVAVMTGATEEALVHYDNSLKMAVEINAIPAALEILAALAGIALDKGEFERALELLGVVLAHPAAPKEALHMFAEPTLVSLQKALSPETIESGLARGKSLGFEKVIAGLLDK